MRLSDTVKTTVLPSGVTVITDHYDRPDDDVYKGMMAAAIIVHTGSLHDPEGKNGLAHLGEHLINHGIPGVTGRELDKKIKSLGLDSSNLTTWPQTTQYHARGHTADVVQYLGLRAAAMNSLAYDQEALKSEQGRIVNEMENQLINPGAMRYITMHRAAFLNRHHSKWLGGLPKELEAMQLDDIREYHQRSHVTGNLSLVTSGGWTHEQACEWAEENLSTLPYGPRCPKLDSKLHYPPYMLFEMPFYTSPYTGPMVSAHIYYPAKNLSNSQFNQVRLVNSIVRNVLHHHAEKNQTYGLGMKTTESGFTDNLSFEMSGSAIRASKLRTELTGNIARLREAIDGITEEDFEDERRIAVRNSKQRYLAQHKDPFERQGAIMGDYLNGDPLNGWEERVESYSSMDVATAKATALKIYGQRPLVLYTAASDQFDFPSSHTLYMAWKGADASGYQRDFGSAVTSPPATADGISANSGSNKKDTTPAP